MEKGPIIQNPRANHVLIFLFAWLKFALLFACLDLCLDYFFWKKTEIDIPKLIFMSVISGLGVVALNRFRAKRMNNQHED